MVLRVAILDTQGGAKVFDSCAAMTFTRENFCSGKGDPILLPVPPEHSELGGGCRCGCHPGFSGARCEVSLGGEFEDFDACFEAFGAPAVQVRGCWLELRIYGLGSIYLALECTVNPDLSPHILYLPSAGFALALI